MSQFAPRISLIELMDVVRDVSRHASPDDPAACTQRAFDEARTPSGHPHAPTAKAIASRLRLPWASALLAAHDASSDTRSIGRRRKGQGGRHGRALEQGYVALRVVARHRGQRSVTRGQYRRSREQIVARDRRGRHGGRADGSLPSINTLDVLFEKEGVSWEQACEAAGLEPAPAPQARRALAWDEVIEVFIEHTGFAPRSITEVRRWAREVGVPLADGSRPIGEDVKSMQAARLAEGLPEIPVAPRGMSFRGLEPPEGYAQRAEMDWNSTTIVAGLAQAIRRIPANQVLLAADLADLRDEYPADGIPPQSTIQKKAKVYGSSFEQWRPEAYEVVTRAG